MTAATISDVRNELVTSSPVAVVRPETTGITDSAARLDVRAMALFTPDAMLTWSGLTAPMTVAVAARRSHEADAEHD